MPRLQQEVFSEDSMKDLIVLVLKSYTVSKKWEHGDVGQAQPVAQQVPVSSQQGLETRERATQFGRPGAQLGLRGIAARRDRRPAGWARSSRRGRTSR